MALSDVERGKRIGELKDHFDISLRELESRTGINYGTLHGWIKKGTYIPIPERKKFAEAFGIKYERFEMTDIENDMKELKHLLDKGWMPKKAIILSESFYDVALGASERFLANCYRGRALVSDSRFEEAHDYFHQAFELSKTLDYKQKRTAIQNLGTYYTDIKDYGKLGSFIARVHAEKKLADDPYSQGLLFHFDGRCAIATGNKELARKLYMMSLENYERATKDQSDAETCNIAYQKIGWIQVNLSDIEFELGNHDKALEYLQFAEVRTRDDNSFIQTVIDKDMARIYKVQKQYDKSIAKIDYRLKQNSNLGVDFIDLTCKMLLMKAEMTNDVELAETIFKDVGGVSQEVRGWAAKFLTNYYMNVNFDLEKMRFYFSIAEKNLSTKAHY